MITTYIIVGLSLIAVLALFATARLGVAKVHSEEELNAKIKPVDLASVANVYDPEQIAYVRSRLSPKEFSCFEKERGRVLIEYVKRISSNSALLVGFAHHIEISEQEPGSELLALALKLRIQSLWTLCLLYVKTLFPWTSIKLDHLLFSYRHALMTARDRNSHAAL